MLVTVGRGVTSRPAAGTVKQYSRSGKVCHLPQDPAISPSSKQAYTKTPHNLAASFVFLNQRWAHGLWLCAYIALARSLKTERGTDRHYQYYDDSSKYRKYVLHHPIRMQCLEEANSRHRGRPATAKGRKWKVGRGWGVAANRDGSFFVSSKPERRRVHCAEL